MKKASLILLITIGIICCSSLISIQTSALSIEKCDQVFIESVSKCLEDRGYNSQNINSEKDILYDIHLNELGVLYSFKVNGQESYAIVIEQDADCFLSECCFETANPYANSEGIRVYINNMVYLQYYEGNYFIAGTDIEVDTNSLEEFLDLAYCGNTDFTVASESIAYIYKNTATYRMATKFPQYTGLSSLENSCAVTAGANILGFYDRYFNELIPNFTAGIAVGANFIYKSRDVNVENVMSQLYGEMGTTNSGTTVEQFKSGMAKYCQSKGRTISFTSCMNSGNLNYDYTKTQISNNKPIALFLSSFNIATINSSSNRDDISYLLSLDNHAMVGFGYLDITYTYQNSTTKNYKYIETATGLSESSAGYFNINYNTNIRDVFAITIY